MIIDAYTHWTPPNYLKQLSNAKSEGAKKAAKYTSQLSREKPNFIQLEKRLEDLDRFGFKMQITMVHSIIEPNTFELDSEENLKLTSILNDDLVELVDKSKGRIAGLGTIPLQALNNGGLEEMERAIDMGLKGFMVPTNSLGKPIDQFFPALEKASKLGVPIYIHPVDTIEKMSRPYEIEFDLMHVLGWPYETSLIWARLVLSGVMERLHQLKIVTHHLGGTIPYLIGRIQESYDSKASKVMNVRGELFNSGNTPTEMLRRFYYDTAIGGNAAAIQCGREVVGIENMVFSTDYPWGPDSGRNRMSTYPDLLRKLNFTEEELETVFSGNITKLLNL
jgi:aminocarboxymuconate-semialdehyde decarboxylase